VRLEITLAGDVSISRGDDDGRELLTGPARVVLAALVLERAAGVGRDALAGIVWPEAMPATWASALRTHVSRARSALARVGGLPGEVIAAAAEGYQLALPPDLELVVDVEHAEARLERARRALLGDPSAAAALARSAAAVAARPFLRGHPGAWADEVRRRLDETAVAALLLAAEAATAQGDGRAAVAAADEAVQRAPLREGAHRTLIAALDASGDRAEALRAYQRLRRLLADELGVDPSPETETAYLALLGPAPAGRPGRAGDHPRAGTARTAVPFVGRATEMSVLAEAWDHAAEGGRQVVVISGEAGIGKSRLATESARAVAERGGLVLFGRCDEEAIVPYQPLVEALDGLVAATPADEMPRLGPEAAAELAALLPALGPDGPGGAGTAAGTSAGAAAGPDARGGRPAVPDRGRLFASVTDLLAAVADDRPVLLVLDDLQWADDDTLLLVRHLLRRAGDAPILVVAITRDHDLGPGHALGEVVHALDRDGWVRRLPLRGLGEDDVLALLGHLRGHGDHRADARRLVAETAGNPFLVTELGRMPATAGAPATEIPQSVHDLVALRVARLAPPIVDLLRAGAVAGSRFDLDVAGAAAGLDEDGLLDAADAALASGLVVEETADRYRFPHDIVRRTLDVQLSGARRRALHRRTADALERLRTRDLDAHAAVLAHHAAAGADPGGDLRAVRWSRRAAAQAARRRAPAEAVRLGRQALEHAPAGEGPMIAEVTVELGLSELSAGEPGAADTLARGAELALRHDRYDALADAALALADASEADPTRRALARDLVDAALTPPDTEGGDDCLALAARLLVRRLRLGGDLGLRPAGSRVPQMLEALHAALLAHTAPADADDRARLADELAELADAAGDARYRVVAAHHQAMAAAEAGDEPVIDKAMATLREATGRGDAFAAAVLAQRAVALLVAEGHVGEATVALAEAATAVGTARAEAPDHPGTALLDRPEQLEGRHRPVLAWLTGTDPPVRRSGRGHGGDRADHDAGRLHDLALDALVAVAHGSTDDIAAARTALSGHADRTCCAGYLSYAGAASFHLGRLAAAAGDGSDAERHLQAALRRHSATHARAWVALTQRALAGVLAARGRPSDRDWIEALRAEADHVTTTLGLRSD